MPALDGTPDESGERELEDVVLRSIRESDSGEDLSEGQKAEIDGLLARLETAGSKQTPRPLNNPLIYGNCDVAYVSTKSAPRQDGQPAGGRFRSGIGRWLFQTRALCQSIQRPDLATNKVEFAFLGCIPGHVGLRGRYSPAPGDNDTVKVDFAPPELVLGPLVLRVGPPSSVVLKTTYLSARLRLGLGSRGSRFVFVRGGCCEDAGMEHVGLARTSVTGWAFLAALAAAGAWAGTAAARAGPLWRRAAAAMGPVLPAALLLGALWAEQSARSAAAGQDAPRAPA